MGYGPYIGQGMGYTIDSMRPQVSSFEAFLLGALRGLPDMADRIMRHKEKMANDERAAKDKAFWQDLALRDRQQGEDTRARQAKLDALKWAMGQYQQGLTYDPGQGVVPTDGSIGPQVARPESVTPSLSWQDAVSQAGNLYGADLSGASAPPSEPFLRQQHAARQKEIQAQEEQQRKEAKDAEAQRHSQFMERIAASNLGLRQETAEDKRKKAAFVQAFNTDPVAQNLKMQVYAAAQQYQAWKKSDASPETKTARLQNYLSRMNVPGSTPDQGAVARMQQDIQAAQQQDATYVQNSFALQKQLSDYAGMLGQMADMGSYQEQAPPATQRPEQNNSGYKKTTTDANGTRTVTVEPIQQKGQAKGTFSKADANTPGAKYGTPPGLPTGWYTYQGN